MSAVYPDITSDAVFTILRTFILTLVDCEVIRSQENRVPMPKGDFITMTPISMSALSYPVDAYTVTAKSILRPTNMRVQIDCYGIRAMDRALTLTTAFRDSLATEQFNDGIQVLYPEEAKQLPLITGEDQFLERWNFYLSLQLNPVIILSQQSANTLTIETINVDARYPA